MKNGELILRRWSVLHRAFVAALFIVGVGAQAFAADATVSAPAAAETTAIEEVVVTGTHIKGIDAETIVPVQTVTAADIEHTGATTAEQLMQSVSVAVQGNSNSVAASGSGATTGGISTISLRGLGSQRTLVLLDGQRMPGGGEITDSLSVDANSIPIAAVERVEVLKDGASAIYGSDAIAGVINFVLKQNYQGMQVTANGDGTSQGGAGAKGLNALAGWGDLARDRYNVMVVANWQKENALMGGQRSFSSSSINAINDTTSGNTFPADFAAADGSIGTVNPMAPNNCAPSVVDPNFPPTRCRFDTAPYVALLPPAERYSLFSAAHFRVTDDAELYANLSYNHGKQTYSIQPAPISDQFAIPATDPISNIAPYNGVSTILLQPSSPFYPTAYVTGITGGATPNLLVRYRSFLTGPRVLTDTTQQPRLVLGAKGTAMGWDYDASVMYAQTKLTEHDVEGYALYSKILPLYNSGQVNFFGPNSAAIQAEAQADNFYGDAYSTTSSTANVQLNVTRQLFDLPGGPVSAATGVEFRKESFKTNPDPTVQIGDVSGYGGNFIPMNRSRNVTAGYAEFNIPIVHSLQADAAVRYDNYQGTGSIVVPKFGLRWKPIPELLLRGSYGKGFRAPALTDLYLANTQGTTQNGLNDPLRCGKTDNNGVVDSSSLDCSTQFTALLGGNSKLQPEKSTTYTFGIVFEPISTVSLGVDAFDIDLTNTIINGFQPSAILNDLTTYGAFVTRGPPDPATPGLPGPITLIGQTNINLGETKVRGLDFDVKVKIPTDTAGTFAFGFTGSYFINYTIQNPDGSFSSVNGQVSPITQGIGGAIPRWHHYLTMDWGNGPWDLFIADNFQSSYTDIPGTLEDPAVPGFRSRTVGAYQTIDMQAAFTGIDHVRLALGVKNVFNTDPPYTNAGGQNVFQAGYDAGYGDPRGRFIHGSVTYTFK
jgi:iron complex outermembrane recepter protein